MRTKVFIAMLFASLFLSLFAQGQNEMQVYDIPHLDKVTDVVKLSDGLPKDTCIRRELPNDYVSLSVAPSFQRVYFGVDEGFQAYNSLGVDLRLMYDSRLSCTSSSFIHVGAGASVRFPLGRISEKLSPRRPDIFAYLEVGWKFGTNAFHAMPLIDFGFAFTRVAKGTVSAVGLELMYDFGRVSVYMVPKMYYNFGLFLGHKYQIAPSIDVGIAMRLFDF